MLSINWMPSSSIIPRRSSLGGDVPPSAIKVPTPDDWILVQVYQDHLHDLVPSTRLLAHRGPSPSLSLAQIEQHCLRHLYLSSLPPRAATPLARTDEPCRNGLLVPPVSLECYLQDSNGTRDDEHTAPLGQLAPSDLSLQPSPPSSPLTELAFDTRDDTQPDRWRIVVSPCYEPDSTADDDYYPQAPLYQYILLGACSEQISRLPILRI
ncbi:MAG: hypothetical protein BYD32DRAFT_457660 [Podila humilis]|nr:MAG: hypothetical protein BYD32DRAFT_457660 [Podila humilis]